jgi:hypothetical protein
MIKTDNMRLPVPTTEEIPGQYKWKYSDRMWKEESDKYKLTPGEFSDWLSRTYNEYVLNNKHITYRESLKLI